MYLAGAHKHGIVLIFSCLFVVRLSNILLAFKVFFLSRLWMKLGGLLELIYVLEAGPLLAFLLIGLI